MSQWTHLQLLISCLVADVRAPSLSRTPHISACTSNSFPLTPSVVFVWLLGFVCLLFPDGRHRLHLSSFQVPREIFTALAEALILFPLVGLYDRPFIHSNWKQLSLPVGAELESLSSSESYIHAAVEGPVCFSMAKWYCPHGITKIYWRSCRLFQMWT